MTFNLLPQYVVYKRSKNFWYYLLGYLVVLTLFGLYLPQAVFGVLLNALYRFLSFRKVRKNEIIDADSKESDIIMENKE